MKKLSDFKNEEGIEVAARVLSVVMEIFANKNNWKKRECKNPLEMFATFMSNSPKQMMKIFAILSEKDENTYSCDGAEAMTNMLILANDYIFVGLFTSQGQMGDATSSGSASENIEE